MRLAAALLIVAGLWMPRTGSATTAADLCPPAADPCNVTANVTATSGSTIDVGTRALVVKSGRTLGIAAGTLSIVAGSLVLEPGAVLGGTTTGNTGASIAVRTTGAVLIDRSGNTRARVELSALLEGGELNVEAGGPVTVHGSLLAKAINIEGSGGDIDISSGGAVLVDGEVNVGGGAQGQGGDVFLSAGANLTVTVPISAEGGDLDGGSIDLSAGGDILTTGRLDVSGAGLAGSGGSVDMDAIGTVRVDGVIAGISAGTLEEGGGSGGEVTISASQDILMNEQVTLTGAPPDGIGGSIDLDAGRDVIQVGDFSGAGPGLESCGGEIGVVAGRNIRLNKIDAPGGACTGGTVLAFALQLLQVPQRIDASASSQGVGGQVILQGETVDMTGDVLASGGTGGNVSIVGCDLTLTNDASLVTTGLNGLNLFRASGQMTIAADVVGPVNRLEYRNPAKPPLLTGAHFTPAPVTVLDPGLPQCRTPVPVVCGNGTQELGEGCDDGNTNNCDGCSATCQPESCGNGVQECNEECDLGPQNGVPGSGCDVTCNTVVVGPIRLHAGGPRTRGCLLEWGVENPNTELKRGFPARKEECIDGDPSCDADGANDGACVFRVTGCLNVTDSRLATCNPPGTGSVNLRAPSKVNPRDAVDRANATALVDALAALDVTVVSGTTVQHQGTAVTARDQCTDEVGVRVPHPAGSIGRRILNGGATDTDGRRMRNNRVRLLCRPNSAVCGNGVEELGEVCDDGNVDDCDGCSSVCREERCGNGAIECGEQCDDGSQNGTAGSTCAANCTLAPPALRIPGNGQRPVDCAVEFSMQVPNPAVDKKGLPSKKQRCHDNDPACDIDPTVGVCKVRVWTCVGGSDARFGCSGVGVASIDLAKPSSRTPGPSRDALLASFATLGLPAPAGERCSPPAVITVPAGRKRFVVRTKAILETARRDNDTLQVECAP